MTEESVAATARLALPDTVKDYLDTCIEGYGLDAITQGVRDCCARRADRLGADTTRLTPEQRREARLWGFGRNIYERTLVDVLDHGWPGSGCK